ncbi:hypothetical protein [Colwellia psychrerythraea]|uniref:Uncharacterized protein n=1 Tax=Colwellia psychrerythraea TaxID=28229 RepID=A0A099KWZ7_COLPS|nr:hypothetical protein [Colwellia psychrerythraea]KGJ95259.1 hypothetical protein ND2E_1041 [Colwellia psychrerythraea]
MNFALSLFQLNERQIRQSVLTLLLFCATLFVHSEHYAQVEFDAYASSEQHDCNLCQQGIDTPPSPIKLYPLSSGVINYDKTRIIKPGLPSPAYVYPPLRAPPSFL